MTLNFLLLALTIALIQLAGAYLRYLPFRGGLTPREGRRLWQLLFTWAVLSISLNTLLLSAYELNVPLYKAILFFGWLPYFLISLVAIKRPRTVHVFVLGMQCLWALTLHTAAAILESLLGFPEDLGSLSFVHAAFYLSLFALLLPAERSVFQSILPSPRLFATFFRWPMSLLPFIIFIGASLPLADSQLFHTWQYRIARLGLPLVFFFVYRAMSIATNQAERSGHNQQESIWMHQYIAVLREYNLLHESRNRELMALWQEMEDSYNHLERYLARGERKKALRYIEALEGRLDRTPLHLFAESPLINAALATYVHRAEELGINPQVTVSLPKNLATDEHELALLTSNLLENAVTAEKHQPPGRRFLSLRLEAENGECLLEIINLSDKPLTFGANHLPRTTRPGRGIGMAYLEEFAGKYQAKVDFTQEKAQVQVSVRWKDAGEKKA